jgi:HD superfamily phosphohydrolase
MFSMVYFHHKSVVFDEMLERYFASADCDYELPSNIEQYCTTNDAELYQHLAKSSNPWARRIVEQKPYSVLIELHSGIPATPSAFERQTQQLQQIEENLTHQKIDYIKATSSSELSKYARKSIHAKAHPIFICYNNHYDAPSYLHLEACTDLFQRYNEKRLITRLYVAPESLSQIRKQLR